MWGLQSGPHVGQAALAGSSPPSPILVTSPSPEVIRYWGLLSTRGGSGRSSAMKVTGQVWHGCEPGGRSICQAVPAAAQGWELCLSIQRAGQEALVSAWLWLLPLPLTLLGGQSSNQHRMRRLPRTLVTGLHSHTCCSQLWPLQHTGNSQLSYY